MNEHIKLFETHADYETYILGDSKVLPNVSLCEDLNELHYNPYIDPYNGHEYVDLGLPSGTKWATMNVGATKPEEYGLYFAWGETQGYADASTKAFSWDDYKWTEDSGSTFTKYNEVDGKTVLDAEDDAVAANWGGSWHMPIEAQCRELFNTNYVTNAWVENYQNSGKNGCLFTSVSNGNTVFIPAAGFYDSNNAYSVDNYGYIWASSLYSSLVEHALSFDFNSDYAGDDTPHYRYFGLSVRGVVG